MTHAPTGAFDRRSFFRRAGAIGTTSLVAGTALAPRARAEEPAPVALATAADAAVREL